jgi:AcrR family transcriptional regulator
VAANKAMLKSKKAPSTTASGAPDLRSRRSEQSQQLILAAAEAEFADKGLAGARVDEIAEESGVNKQMIYYYYGSKEDLYLAVLEPFASWSSSSSTITRRTP